MLSNLYENIIFIIIIIYLLSTTVKELFVRKW